MTDSDDIKALVARLQSPEHIRQMRASSRQSFAKLEGDLMRALLRSSFEPSSAAYQAALTILGQGQAAREKIDQDLSDEIARREAAQPKPPTST